MSAAAVHNNHRTIVQIAYTLSGFFSGFDYRNLHFLAGQHNRLNGICQFIDIQHPYTLKFRNFIQVEIVRHYKCVHIFRHFQQHGINLHKLRRCKFLDFHRYSKLFLYLIQDIQSAAAPVAFQAVRRIRNMPQFFQNKRRNNNLAFNKPRLQNIQNTPVNNHAGIQYFGPASYKRFFRYRRSCQQHLLQFADIYLIFFPPCHTDAQNTKQEI